MAAADAQRRRCAGPCGAAATEQSGRGACIGIGIGICVCFCFCIRVWSCVCICAWVCVSGDVRLAARLEAVRRVHVIELGLAHVGEVDLGGAVPLQLRSLLPSQG